MEKRKNYFIEKKFQTDFILRFCWVVAGTCVFTIAVLYVLTGKTTTVSFVNLRVVVQSTADYLFPLLIQTFIASTIIVSLAAICMALFVSHRIAGPSYRFKQVLSALGEGDFSLRVNLRSKDSLKDVAFAFNDMIAGVREKLGLIDGNLKTLKEKLEAGDLKECKKSALAVDKTLHNFKF